MKNAELSFVEWGSDVHVPPNNIENTRRIAEMQAEYGVKCSSYGTYFKIGVNPIEELLDCINTAKILGTNVLRLWCGNKNSEKYTEEEKQKLFEECKRLSHIAEQQRSILCMECHSGTFTNTPESALELMQSVNSEHFKMYWQPNQYRTEQENIESAEYLAPHTVNIHVFNWKGKNKLPLCEAVGIWQQYLAQFNREHTLLLEFMPDDRIESLKTESKVLKELAE